MEAEFEVRCDDEWVAGTAGPREIALAEAMHYAQQYAIDGPAEVWEITRSKVAEVTSPSPPTGADQWLKPKH